MAKYSYNPFEYSPNENPEAELQLNAGDYVLVLGDMDEVSFLERQRQRERERGAKGRGERERKRERERRHRQL